MREPVTDNRSAYHRPVSNRRETDVSFSDASEPSILDNPTMFPPQPPTIHEQKELRTGNVIPAKKSDPSARIASHRNSKSDRGSGEVRVMPVRRPFSSTIDPFSTRTAPRPEKGVSFQPSRLWPSNSGCHSAAEAR